MMTLYAILCNRLLFSFGFPSKNAFFGEAFCFQGPSRARREATLSNFSTAPRAQLLCLDDEQGIVGGQWPTYRLYLAQATRTQGIEPHAVLSGHQMFGELGA